jgi:sugar phosphate isomerase/epimerase
MQRRQFLQAAGAVGLMSLGGSSLLAAGAQVAAAPHAEKLGWRLGCLFNCFAPPILNDAVDQVASLGLRYLEGGSRPTISADSPKLHLDAATPADIRQAFRARLAASQVKLASYYTYKKKADQDEWRREFAFAKEMGVEIMVAEPEPAAFDFLGKLCDENQICLAIHNHPSPSHYWNYEKVLDVCRDRTRRIGVCADTGHWVRSGIDPVEAIKQTAGRLIALHLKDVDKIELKAKQVTWGTGKGNVKGVLQEIHRQGVKPLFIMEYEREVSRSEIVECIQYFDSVAAELLAGR